MLYTFTGGTDGGNPFAGLITDKEGALYGTTGSGGSGCPYAASRCGTVFKLTPPAKDQSNWTETVLYSFSGSDGAYPQTNLIADKQGVLYGTTNGDGTGILINKGTVFKLTPPASGQTAWTHTVLYSFCSLSNCSDGAGPAAGLIADKQGVLYGTTVSGGVGVGVGGSSCSSGCGTVFKLTPPASGRTAWTHTVLYSFSGTDGVTPLAGLIADKQGAIYGTTVSGGVGCPQTPIGCGGTVFKLTPPGNNQTAWTGPCSIASARCQTAATVPALQLA